ncbi:RNA exonuclease 4-like [Hibiscus syriacus]|uniref:RNA exonuclease 4-like n=1 Tax=Hibiscus syriacus TaxID=106335 RepID=A0A6A2YP44_HIBSY|nr:RNA exonuclease 4-like [Hibiscus syriacus]
MRSGYGRSIFEPLLPLILGRDVSGEVAAVGAQVKSLTVGQEVFGALHPTAVRGTYTDYAILSKDELSPKPASVTHVEASAIPFAALTAWRALKSTARISEGQRLLVIGGGGAVGAEQAVDYTSEDIESVIKGKFDAVLDTIGVPETERIGTNLLNRGGHYMTLQGEAAALSDRYGLPIGLPVATAVLWKKKIQYKYSHGIEYSWIYMRADLEGLHEIRKLSEAGKLTVPVEKTFPITRVREAHEAKDKKLILGKVVLELD